MRNGAARVFAKKTATRIATHPPFAASKPQHREALQRIKAAAAKSFAIPQPSRVAQRSRFFELDTASAAFAAGTLCETLVCPTIR